MRVKIPIYILILFYMILLKVTQTIHTNNRHASEKSKIIYFLNVVIIITFIISHQKLQREVVEGHRFQQYTIESYDSVTKIHGNNIIFLPLKIKTINNTVSPLYECKALPNYNALPIGWMIRSPIYYQYLGKFGISNKNGLMNYIVDNDKVVLSYYWSKNNEFLDDFVNFINRHYAPLNKKLVLEMVVDKRKNFTDGQEGWIFYKIVTERL